MKPMIFTTPEPIGGDGYSCRSPPFTLPPYINLLYLLKEKIIGTVQNLHSWQDKNSMLQ